MDLVEAFHSWGWPWPVVWAKVWIKDVSPATKRLWVTISFIQTTIQPIANDLANSWTSYFGLEGLKIVSDFSHVPVMQHTESKKAEKALKIATAFQRLVQSGLSSDQAQTFLEEQGINFVDEG